jgi:hypothetical protein
MPQAPPPPPRPQAPPSPPKADPFAAPPSRPPAQTVTPPSGPPPRPTAAPLDLDVPEIFLEPDLEEPATVEETNIDIDVLDDDLADLAEDDTRRPAPPPPPRPAPPETPPLDLDLTAEADDSLITEIQGVLSATGDLGGGPAAAGQPFPGAAETFMVPPASLEEASPIDLDDDKLDLDSQDVNLDGLDDLDDL